LNPKGKAKAEREEPVVKTKEVSAGKSKKPDSNDFVTHSIKDPTFNNAEAATLLLPKGWQFEGKVAWTIDQHQTDVNVSFSVTSPGGDVEFHYNGPNVGRFYYDNSQFAAMQAAQLGRRLLNPVASEEVTRMTLDIIPEFTDVRILGVDKLEKKDGLRKAERAEELRMWGPYGLLEYVIDESEVKVSCRSKGARWVLLIYNRADYRYMGSMFGTVCNWKTGPLAICAVRGGNADPEEQRKTFEAIEASFVLNPVWKEASEALITQVEQMKLQNALERQQHISRNSQSTYNRTEKEVRERERKGETVIEIRQKSKGRAEAISDAMSGWTDVIMQ